VAAQQAERAAGLDGGKLAGVTDQQQLGPGAADLTGQVRQGEGVAHSGLVDDEEPGSEAPPVELRPSLGLGQTAA